MVLLKMLNELLRHMEKSLSANQSFLAIITGIYEIKMVGFKKVNLMVMRNCV